MTRFSQGIHGETSAQPFSLKERALALAETLPEVCLSDVTAASCLGLWLPPEVRDDQQIHLTQQTGTTRRIRRPEVTGHRRRLREEETVRIGPARVTSAARTWFDLSASCSVQSLVMLGDHLVRKPRQRFEGRSSPFATSAELFRVVERAGRVKGKARAREALGRIRGGADSVKETALRLALVDSDLPEPELQVPADPHMEFSPCADLGYPQLKIAIQYDGESHFTPAQARRDQARNNAFLSRGWLLLQFNADDARDGFRRSTYQVRSALRIRTSA